MGNDGGTKALQRKFSRWGRKKEEVHYECDEQIQAKWSTCSLSGEVLQVPICSCEMGYLFNKEAVIQGIIDKSLPEEFSHIRRLKDIIDLHFTVNPDFNEKYTGDSKNYWQQDILGGRYICPITKETIGGKTKFCFLRSCGCVIAEKAIKEIPSDACLICGKKMEADDMVILNGTDEERKVLKERMETRRKCERNSKKRSSSTKAPTEDKVKKLE